jgi:hypothetical protein
VPSWSVWDSDAVSSLLGAAALLGWIWIMGGDLVTIVTIRRMPSRRDFRQISTRRGLVVFGLSIMFVSYQFVTQARTGIWYPSDYRNSDWWILLNQSIVVIAGPAFILGGIALWLRDKARHTQ